MLLKKLWARVDRYTLWAGIIILCAVALRLGLAILGWPQTNSDEATMGLMGLHILKHVQYPIFFYGQQYMGATEAYLASAVFRVLGSTVFALRLVTAGLFAVFLVCMYYLTSLLYSRKLALVTLALLSVGSNIMLFSEVMAIGGYPEMLACGSLLFLMTARFALAERQPAFSATWWQAMLLYGCWGLVAGIGFWSDYLMLLMIALAAFVLLCFCWRRLLKGGIVALLLGFALGTYPLIIYNLHSPPSTRTLAVIWSLHNNFVGLMSQAHIGGLSAYLRGAVGTLLVSLPSITGAPSYCYDANLITHGYPTMQAFQCWQVQGHWGLVIVDGLWSVGFLLLWLIAMVYALRGVVRAWPRLHAAERSQEDRRSLVVQGCRLLLLMSAGVTLAQFAASPVAVVFPTNARYLVPVLISTPALLAPLVENLRYRARTGELTRTGMGRWLKSASLALIATALLFGTLATFGEIAPARAYADQQQALISNFEHNHITRIYSDYWMCDRIMFLTRERILCGALNEQLQPTHNRYPWYYVIVSGDPRSTYVFLLGAGQLTTLDKTSALASKHIHRYTLSGYEVLQPR